MKDINIDNMLAPFSKVIARTFFNEKFDRTLSQKVEDEIGIPKKIFHVGLGIVGAIILANYINSRD